MIANGPTARKLDKRYNRRHILFQEAVTHEARALLYERPAPAPRHHPGRPNRRPSGKPRRDSDAARRHAGGEIASALVPSSTRAFLEGGPAAEEAIAGIKEWVTV